MEYQDKKQSKQIRQNNLKDPKEWNRILMQYGGIFKQNIKEFAEELPKIKKIIKNYSK